MSWKTTISTTISTVTTADRNTRYRTMQQQSALWFTTFSKEEALFTGEWGGNNSTYSTPPGKMVLVNTLEPNVVFFRKLATLMADWKDARFVRQLRKWCQERAVYTVYLFFRRGVGVITDKGKEAYKPVPFQLEILSLFSSFLASLPRLVLLNCILLESSYDL